MLESWRSNERMNIICTSLLDLSDTEIIEMILGCHSITSCLRHNINWKEIYGQPRKLVTDIARRPCKAIEINKPKKSIKYVLMNTTGNSIRDLNEPISFS